MDPLHGRIDDVDERGFSQLLVYYSAFSGQPGE
jgi:hypothetical protein